MQELVGNVFNAPLGTIFVLAGVVFLLIAVIGNISGKIETGTKARVLSAVLGSAFITIGLSMYWTSRPTSTDVPIPQSPQVKLPKPPEKDKPAPQPQPIPDILTHSITDQLPEWVPVYPGAKVESVSVKKREGGGQYGSYFFISGDPYVNTVLKFYQTNLEMKHFDVKIKDGTLSATNEGGNQSIVVTSGEAIGVSAHKYAITFSESPN